MSVHLNKQLPASVGETRAYKVISACALVTGAIGTSFMARGLRQAERGEKPTHAYRGAAWLLFGGLVLNGAIADPMYARARRRAESSGSTRK